MKQKKPPKSYQEQVQDIKDKVESITKQEKVIITKKNLPMVIDAYVKSITDEKKFELEYKMFDRPSACQDMTKARVSRMRLAVALRKFCKKLE